MKLLGTLHRLDDQRGAVRVEDVYATDIEDLWEACTDPDRLARWIAEVSGDLRVGGTVELVFTSTWAGPAVIETCDAPHHLLLITQPGTEEEGQLEAWLTSEGTGTRVVVEERGLPVDKLHYYGSGWQAHLEDLRSSLASSGPVHPDGYGPERAASAWHARWTELTAAYEREAAVR
jgi:uncharacterized protein YndB with AHSA1/START domain